MKCKICGHRANSLSAINAHYRKAHPGRPRKQKSPPRELTIGGPISGHMKGRAEIEAKASEMLQMSNNAVTPEGKNWAWGWYRGLQWVLGYD